METEAELQGRRLRGLLDSLPDGVVEIDADGTITFASRRLEEMFGYGPGELPGKVVEELVPKPYRQAHVGHRTRYFSRGAGRPLGAVAGLSGLRKGGETFPASIALGVPSGGRAVAVLRDETERNRTEEALRLRDAAVESTAAAVVITDAAGTIQYVNPAFTAITGYAPEEAVGKSTRMLKSDAHPPEFYRGLWVTIKEGRVWKGSMVNRRKDGALYHEEMTISPVRGEGGAITHFVAVKQDDTPRWRAEESLRKLNRAYRTLSECNQALIRAGDEKAWVRRMCRIITEFGGYRTAWVAYGPPGLALEAWDGRECDPPLALARVEKALGAGAESVTRSATADGSTAVLPLCAEGTVIGVLGIHADEADAFDAAEMRLVRELAGDMAYGIASLRAKVAREEAMADLRRSEEQFRHSQKMETAGRLAGGVAHDFNNLLTVIMGVSSEACAELPAGDPRREDMELVLSAARKGADLTRQLLAFSRRRVLATETFDLAGVARDMVGMLARLIGEDVELCITADPEPVWVHADRGSLEQVVLNLAVNARDAMPKGGRVSIRVHAAEVPDPRPCYDGQLPPGRYALLIVEDTGIGMGEEVRSRVFEPFFTTKPPGKGTGLGLAAVYGTVRQSGGRIGLRSAPGQGTSFEVFLPRVSRPNAPRGTPVQSELPEAEGTVLIVEDEPGVRHLAARALTAAGFEVVAAADPEAALALLPGIREKLRIVLTDVVMPGMAGPDLVARIRTARPGLRALYMSGYTEHSTLQSAAGEVSRCFLQKPFTPSQLARRVLETLAEPEGG